MAIDCSLASLNVLVDATIEVSLASLNVLAEPTGIEVSLASFNTLAQIPSGITIRIRAAQIIG